MATRSTNVDAVKQVRPAVGALPPWFTKNRVHGHTRLILRLWHDTDGFALAAAGFKALGAHVFTRHVKTGARGSLVADGATAGRNVVAAVHQERARRGSEDLHVLLAHVRDESAKASSGLGVQEAERQPDQGRTKGPTWTSPGRTARLS